MDQPTIENAPELTQNEVFALTDVYTSAGVMVRALASMKQGWSNRVPQVKAFQESWNANIVVLRAWSGPAEGLTGKNLAEGLVPDGRYGVATADALGTLIYLISSTFDDAVAAIPLQASGMPVWYAQYRSSIESALTTNFSLVSTADPTEVTINTEEIAQNTLEDSSGTAELPSDDTGGDITFEEPTTIVSTAKREGWNVPIWAIGLGLATAGTLLFFIAKKTRKRGSAAA